jgi:hypothetical protein
MAQNLRLARLYLVLLAIVASGRWLLSFRVAYEVGTDKMSIVILTIFASVFYGAFCRRWRGYSLLQAMGLAATLAVFGQLVIVLSTLASYALGLETYFNHPKALNLEGVVPLSAALVSRARGLLANTILNGIVGMLGWALGGLLPADAK